MTATTKPLEEVLRQADEQLRKVVGTDPERAPYGRLMPHMYRTLLQWQHEEIERGTAPEAMGLAMVNAIGWLAIQSAGAGASQHPGGIQGNLAAFLAEAYEAGLNMWRKTQARDVQTFIKVPERGGNA